MFNKDKSSVALGFGLLPEDFKKYSDELHLEGKVVNEAIESVLLANLTEDEKFAMIFEIGANFGQIVFVKALQEQALAEQSEVLSQLAKKGEIETY